MSERLSQGPPGTKERLQKVLARAGYGSRRSAETLISAGRVKVNGAIASLGMQVDSATDRLEVDGKRLITGTSEIYLAMHKPSGFTTTVADRHAERTVMELLPSDLPPHVLPVGRLDKDSEGLLIFTNDGALAHRLAHPRYQIDKEYLALVKGKPSAAALAQLRTGVLLDGKRTSAADVAFSAPPLGHDELEGHTWLRIVIHEGRNRQVRRMCFAVGHVVKVLVRTRIGPVGLGRLGRGKTRTLSARELRAIRAALEASDRP